MKIDKIVFSEQFKRSVSSAVQAMLSEKKYSRKLEGPYGNYIVAIESSYGPNLINVFSGEEIGTKDIKEVFLFIEKM